MKTTVAALLVTGLALAVAAGTASAAEPWVPRHNVIIEPGDVTPLHTRRPPPLGPRLPGPPEHPRERRDPVLEQQLDRLESRTLAAPDARLPQLRREQVLGEAEQRLRRLETGTPGASAVPVHRRELEWIDSLQRSAARRLREAREAETE